MPELRPERLAKVGQPDVAGPPGPSPRYRGRSGGAVGRALMFRASSHGVLIDTIRPSMTSTPGPSLTAGTRSGPYEVLGSARRGGMGEVYRARDRRLGREVAVKVLPPSSARTRPAGALRARGARARLAQPPNIARLYGFEDEGPPLLVMELVDGETLADRSRAGRLRSRRRCHRPRRSPRHSTPRTTRASCTAT